MVRERKKMHAMRDSKDLYSVFFFKFLYASPYDNKSVSHWIMFDYFFHVSKINIFFFLMCGSEKGCEGQTQLQYF